MPIPPLRAPKKSWYESWMLWRYIRESLHLSFAFWGAKKRMWTLLTQVFSAIIALLGMFGLSVFIDQSIYKAVVIFFSFYFAALVFWVAPYGMWTKEREKVEELEKRIRPKVELAEIVETQEPKRARAHARRTFSVMIRNTSEAETITGCRVKMIGFVNRHGQQTDTPGTPFRINTDDPDDIRGFDYRQSFDLPPGDTQLVDICKMDEVDERSDVIMLYASRKGVLLKNSIPRRFFPHELKLRISAENMGRPVEKDFAIYVTQDGFLRMAAADESDVSRSMSQP